MASITNIGISALMAYQRSLNTTGHNIANVDTPGYSRQTVRLSTQVPQASGAGYIGSGVKIDSVERVYNDFLAAQMRSAQAATARFDGFYQSASRIDDLLADPNIGLNPTLQQFFDGLQGLADDPASIPARQLALADAESLVERFHYLDARFDDARGRLNQQLTDLIDEVNSMAASLAELNTNITAAYGAGGGHDPNDLLDQREDLLNQLSERVAVTTVEQDDGSYSVFFGKGEILVMGSRHNALEVTIGDPDASAREIHFVANGNDVTHSITGGELGGLLEFRDQILDPGQSRLGLIALGLASDMNAQHRLGIDLDGTFGEELFTIPAIGVKSDRDNSGSGGLAVAVADPGAMVVSDYLLRYEGANQYSLIRRADDTTTTIDTGGAPSFTTTADGLTLTINAGAAVGDSFLFQPTRDLPGELALRISDPRKLAAAGALTSRVAVDANGNPTNAGSARIGLPGVATATGLPFAADMTLQFSNNADGAGNPGFVISNGPGAPNDVLLYDPATESNGKDFPTATNPTQFAAFAGLNFRISGVPQPGDELVIGNNTAGVSDNRNALALVELQRANRLLGGSATYQEVYAQMVAEIGTRTRQAEVNQAAQNGLLERHKNALASESGVNLDEEAANLIRYQQAYQAAAQVINVARTVFDTLIGAVGR